MEEHVFNTYVEVLNAIVTRSSWENIVKCVRILFLHGYIIKALFDVVILCKIYLNIVN